MKKLKKKKIITMKLLSQMKKPSKKLNKKLSKKLSKKLNKKLKTKIKTKIKMKRRKATQLYLKRNCNIKEEII